MGGSPPLYNCGASPNPRAGLEAVPLPLGLAQASGDPLKWVPGKSCPGALGAGRGAGPQLGQRWGLPCLGGWGPALQPSIHLPPGLTAPFLWTLGLLLPVVTPHFSWPSFPLWPYPPPPLPNSAWTLHSRKLSLTILGPQPSSLP